MLWIKSVHIITMITWMAGIFYLPRLFVYHAQANAQADAVGDARFKIMERKLFWGIMTPGAILTIIFGCWLWFGYGISGKWLMWKLADQDNISIDSGVFLNLGIAANHSQTAIQCIFAFQRVVLPKQHYISVRALCKYVPSWQNQHCQHNDHANEINFLFHIYTLTPGSFCENRQIDTIHNKLSPANADTSIIQT